MTITLSNNKSDFPHYVILRSISFALVPIKLFFVVIMKAF